MNIYGPSGGNPIKIPLNAIILHEHSRFDGINCNPKIPNHFNALRFIFTLPFVGNADGAKKNVTKKMFSTRKKESGTMYIEGPFLCCTHTTSEKIIHPKKKKQKKILKRLAYFRKYFACIVQFIPHTYVKFTPPFTTSTHFIKSFSFHVRAETCENRFV